MNEPTHIKHLKKGDTCWRLTERYNPQLGTYYYVTKETVARVNTKTLSINSDTTSVNKYNLSDGSQAVDGLQTYGDTSHHLYTTKSVIDKIIELKNNGVLFNNLPQEILDLIAKKEAEAVTV